MISDVRGMCQEVSNTEHSAAVHGYNPISVLLVVKSVIIIMSKPSNPINVRADKAGNPIE